MATPRRGCGFDAIAGLSLAAFAIPELLAYASLADLPADLGPLLLSGGGRCLCDLRRQPAAGGRSDLGPGDRRGGQHRGHGRRRHRAGRCPRRGDRPAGRADRRGRPLSRPGERRLFPVGHGGDRLQDRRRHLHRLDTASQAVRHRGRARATSSRASSMSRVTSADACSDAGRRRRRDRPVPGPRAALPGRPTTLLVVAAAIAATRFLGLDKLGIKLVGELPTGLPAIGLPANPSVRSHRARAHGDGLLPAGLWRDDLGGAQLRAEARLRDRSRSRAHGLGMANIATGLARGFPVAGGMSQTAINDMGGATSPLSLVVHLRRRHAHPAVLRRAVP